jgi:hypothetical protein
MEVYLLAVVVAVVAVTAFIYMLRRWTRPPEPRRAPDDTAEVDPARALFAAAGDEPPTEDQIAQARLGGVRGNPKLGRAQMSGQVEEQTPKNIDDGHVT